MGCGVGEEARGLPGVKTLPTLRSYQVSLSYRRRMVNGSLMREESPIMSTQKPRSVNALMPDTRTDRHEGRLSACNRSLCLGTGWSGMVPASRTFQLGYNGLHIGTERREFAGHHRRGSLRQVGQVIEPSPVVVEVVVVALEMPKTQQSQRRW